MTATTKRRAVGPEHWEDLIGKSWDDVGRCTGLAVTVLRRIGYDVSDLTGGDAASVADGVAAVRSQFDRVRAGEAGPGDLLAFDDARGRPHVAVLLPDGYMVHAMEGHGVVCTRRPASPKGAAFLRPKAEGVSNKGQAAIVRPESAVAPENAPELRLATPIHVILIGDILRPAETRTEHQAPWSGLPVRSLVPEGWGDPDGTSVIINGKRLAPADWDVLAPLPGETVVIARAPGFGAAAFAALKASAGGALLTASGGLTVLGAALATVANLAVGLGLSYVAGVLTAPPTPARDEGSDSSPTYDLTGARNSFRNGRHIPVVYGEHLTGGQLLQVFTRTDGQGRSVLFMLLGLSHGVIESIAGVDYDTDEMPADQIPGELTINGNPAGNFSDVRISTRMGTTGQDPIPGFRDIVTAAPVNVTLDDSPNADFTNAYRHRTTGPCQAFEVNFTFPQGLINYGVSGSPGPRAFYYEVRYRLLGTTTWTTSGQQIFIDETRGQTNHTFRVDGLSQGTYEIDIDRQAPAHPETDPDKASQSDIDSINEILYDDLSYPNIALLAVRAIATEQLSGQLPTVLARVKGKKVWVWDGVSATSPAYTQQWTDDPAWIAHDILTNPTYGGGQVMRGQDMDLATFATASTFFAEQVSDGRGGTFNRGVCNVVFDATAKLWDAANSVLTPFRAGLVQAGRKVRVKVEKAYSSISQLFGDGSIVQGSAEITYRNPDLAANIVNVDFWNEETNYEQDQTSRENQTSLDNGDPVIPSTLTMRGVTHPARAARAAQFHLNVERALLKSIRFDVPVEGLTTEPGDVFAFQHRMRAATNVYGGRCVSSTTTTIVLDRDVDLPSGTNKITARTKGGGVFEVQERTISSAAGTYSQGDSITVSSAWNSGDTPQAGDPYVIGPEATYRKLYRCVRTEVTQDFQVTVEGIEYDASVYDDDPGTVEAATDELPDQRKIPDAVSNVSGFERRLVNGDGSITTAVDVSWDTARGEDCDVYTRVLGEGVVDAERAFRHQGSSETGRLTVADLDVDRVYQVTVVPRTPLGARGEIRSGASTTVAPRGQDRQPSDVSNFTVDRVDGQLVFRWDEVSDRDVIGYQIRRVDGDAGTWLSGLVLQDCATGNTWSYPNPTFGAATYGIKAVNAAGYQSNGFTAVQTSGGAATSYKHLRTATAENPTWGGTKSNCTVVSNVLTQDSGTSQATYTTSTLSLTSVANARVLVDLVTDVAEAEPTVAQLAIALWRPYWDRTVGDIEGKNLEGHEGIDAYSVNSLCIPLQDDPHLNVAGVLKQGSRWYEECGFTVEVRTSDDGGSSWTDWARYHPFARDLDAVEVRVTMDAPEGSDIRLALQSMTVYIVEEATSLDLGAEEIPLTWDVLVQGGDPIMDLNTGTYQERYVNVTAATDPDGLVFGIPMPSTGDYGWAFHSVVPYELDTTKPVAATVIFHASGLNNDTVIEWETRAAADNESPTGGVASVGSVVFDTSSGHVSDDYCYVSLDSAFFDADELEGGDIIHGAIIRNAVSNASDTNTGFVRLIGIVFEGTRKARA